MMKMIRQPSWSRLVQSEVGERVSCQVLLCCVAIPVVMIQALHSTPPGMILISSLVMAAKKLVMAASVICFPILRVP
jgi:hypothetical protein